MAIVPSLSPPTLPSMANHRLCSYLLVFITMSIRSCGLAGANGVLELTDATFDAAIASHDYIFVDFYAPWCGHCKSLSPQLELAAPRLAEKIPSIVVAKINVDKYTKIRSKYGVSAYPTLKLFIKGFPVDYNGPRQALSLSSHLEKLAHPDVEVLQTEVELEKFLRQRDRNLPIFICFGIQSLMVADLAKEHKSQAWFVFLEEFSEKVMDAYDFDRGPAIVARSVIGEEEVFYGPFTGEDLGLFVKQNLLPRVNEVTPENLRKLLDDGRPIALTILRDDSSTQSISFIKMLKAAAPANRGFIFAYVDSLKWRSFCQTFRIHRYSNFPRLVIWDGGTTFFESAEDYDFSGERAGSYITFFLQEVKEGKAKKINVRGPTLTEFLWSLVSVRSFYLMMFIIALIFFGRSGWGTIGTEKVVCEQSIDRSNNVQKNPLASSISDNISVKEE